VKHDWDPEFEQCALIVSPRDGAQQKSLLLGDISCEMLKSRTGMAAMSKQPSSIRNACQNDEDSDAAPEFWIFLVEGNESAARALVRRMGEAGAIYRNPFSFFEVGQKIGSGGYAHVYAAKHRHADNVSNAGCKDAVAVKVLKPKSKCATAIAELGVIQHEITIMVHAGGHPNIVGFLGVFCLEQEDKTMNADANKILSSFSPSGLIPRWALVSEYLAGGDLYDAVCKRRFKEPSAYRVMADLFSALAHIHRHGIVHRDVKAENLLLTKHGKAVLADFGIAAFISDDEEMCKLSGSPGYAAPEVISKTQYGSKIDIFSAGVLLYFVFCGQLPFRGSSKTSVLKQTVEDEVSFNNNVEFSEVSGQCKHFILQLLQKDPHNRPTAEQSRSQMWSSGGDMECTQHTWTTSVVDGRSSTDQDSRKREERRVEEDDLDSTRDSLGQRASYGGWSRKIGRLMSKPRSNNVKGQVSHRSNVNMERTRSERRKSRTCEREALHVKTSGGLSTILPVESDNSVAQPPSQASGGPSSYMMRGRLGHLLQRLRSANAPELHEIQPGTPTRQLAAGRGPQLVQAKSWWALLPRGCNRKEDRRVHPGDAM